MNLYKATIINEQQQKQKQTKSSSSSLLSSYQKSWKPIVNSIENRLYPLMESLFFRRFSKAIAAYNEREKQRETRMDEIRQKQEESGYLPPPCTCRGGNRGRGGSSNNKGRCLSCSRKDKDTRRSPGHTKNPKIKNIVWDSSYRGLTAMLMNAVDTFKNRNQLKSSMHSQQQHNGKQLYQFYYVLYIIMKFINKFKRQMF
eukprot:UN03010